MLCGCCVALFKSTHRSASSFVYATSIGSRSEPTQMSATANRYKDKNEKKAIAGNIEIDEHVYKRKKGRGHGDIS